MLGLNPGDKVILRINYEGKSGIYFYRSLLVVSDADYENAKKLMREEKLKLHEIFDNIGPHESIMQVGSPIFNAVKNGALDTWISVPLYKNNASEDVCAKYFIKNIIYGTPPIYMQIMMAIDTNWFNYTNEDDDKSDEGIKLLTEQMLLYIADELNKSKYIHSLTLLHNIHSTWSYKRLLNMIVEIKKRNLIQTYGYFNNESKT